MARAFLYTGFCLFLCSQWIQRSSCANFVVVKALQSHKEIMKYWTVERIASAKPIFASNFSAMDTPKRKINDRPSIKLKGKKIKGKNQIDLKDTLGRLFFTIGSRDHICSGNVVISDSVNVVATARHCGFNDGGGNYIFAPSYNIGTSPHGRWTWREAVWTNISGIEGDTAFLVLNDQDGRSLQDVVGSSGIAFGESPESVGYAYLWGIPGDIDYAIKNEGDTGSMYNDAVVSIRRAEGGLTSGADGGAFYVNDDGEYYQTATYTGYVADEPCGPLFGDEAFDAYNQANSASFRFQ